MIEITMPRLSDTMEEGAVASWHKQPGDRVEVGDVLVEIETDKATMDYEAYEAGTLAEILVPEGKFVPIGTPIALLDGENSSDPSTPGVPTSSFAEVPVTEHADSDTAHGLNHFAPVPIEGANADRLFASPLTRKLSRENHLDLSQIRGTGPGGRIIRSDIIELLPQPTSTGIRVGVPALTHSAGLAAGAMRPIDEKRASEVVPLTNTRRVIARRMGESARNTPHFYVTAVADAEALVQLRTQLNAQLMVVGRSKVSINDLLIRASALALCENPLVNASYVDEVSTTMLVHHRINVGVAVASENGLVVPVIEDADQKTVSQLGLEVKRLASLASTKGLTTEQMSGGTFTISNLGMFGVEQFTAIINPPEGAILAVGNMVREPIVIGDDIVARHRMRYTLSADHRIIDGTMAAQFVQTFTRLIEHPWTIIA
jgi:pyruvate dehydrogenase E2 component (dihydrolipoamide acetyltransferase)